MLAWAKANGCPWTERTCNRIARGGHLAVLQWQGLTLVHFLAKLKRFLWDRGCIQGSSGVFRVSRGTRGYPGCILCQKRLRLS